MITAIGDIFLETVDGNIVMIIGINHNEFCTQVVWRRSKDRVYEICEYQNRELEEVIARGYLVHYNMDYSGSSL